MAANLPIPDDSEFWHDPEFPELESRRSCQEISCYRPHAHQRFSMGIIDEGETKFTGHDGQQATLVPGDVIVIPRDHLHACNPKNGYWRYQMIHADQSWISRLAPIPAQDLFWGIRIFRVPELYELMNDFNQQLFAGMERRSVEQSLGSMLSVVQGLAPVFEALPPGIGPGDARLLPVLQRLGNDAVAPQLGELALLAGLSKYQLIRLMHSSTGFTPIAWRHNQLVNRSRELLRSGASIAQTAAELGFSDQSHFHRVFRSHVAAAPGKYRAPLQYRSRP
ncbi:MULTISPECIES: helix-turn-helix transcriptional regulator [Glutamicibacter]|nr:MULTISPECIES: helix-turn-helix transcriptional regulator [Glutamicibacter]